MRAPTGEETETNDQGDDACDEIHCGSSSDGTGTTSQGSVTGGDGSSSPDAGTTGDSSTSDDDQGESQTSSDTGDDTSSDTGDDTTSGTGDDTTSGTESDDTSDDTTSGTGDDTTSADTTDGDTGDVGPGCSATVDANAFDGFTIDGTGCRIQNVVGDINGDGKGEYVIEFGTYVRQWGLIEGKSDRSTVDGAAALEAATWKTSGETGISRGGFDFDGDALGDFTWESKYEQTPVRHSLVFGGPSPGGASFGDMVRNVAPGDFNGDGLTDAVLTFATLDGSSPPPAPFVIFGNDARQISDYAQAEIGQGGFILAGCPHDEEAIALGDFNGDGLDDFSISPSGAGPHGIFGKVGGDAIDCDQLVASGQGFEFMPQDPNWLIGLGDLDDDGYDDIYANGRMIRGHDVGTAVDISAAEGYTIPFGFGLGQFNDDGIADLYYPDLANDRVTIIFGGEWFTDFDLDTPPAGHSMVLSFPEPQPLLDSLRVGDVNGDGCDDFATSRSAISYPEPCGHVRFTPNAP